MWNTTTLDIRSAEDIPFRGDGKGAGQRSGALSMLDLSGYKESTRREVRLFARLRLTEEDEKGPGQ